jgi:putative ABC transport system permease protein
VWKAALKSLLGRKLRLLMSTFAIVLGVAFVAGSLIFSDTLDRSFTAIFASSVGDVVVRPVGGQAEDGSPTARTVPARTAEQLASVPGAARVDGNVSAIGVYVIGTDDKAVGGFGPPALGGNWTGAPAGHGLEGLTITEGHEPRGPDEVVLDERTAERGGYAVGDEVHIVTAGSQEILRPTLVGLADFADGGSLNGATFSAFDTQTAQDLFLQGKDAYTDLWVTAADGVSQEQLRDEVAQRLPDGLEAITGDDLAEEQADSLLQALSFIRTFLLIFAGVSLVVGAFLIVNTFSILVAQRSRELALLRALGASKRQVTRSVLLEAFVLGVIGATLGLGLGVVLALAIRALFSQFGLDLTGSLVFEPRTVVAAYVVGIVVTMAAAWLPAWHTARIAPVQALRDDVAMPETAVHRRVVAGVVLMLLGGTLLGLGLFAGVPHAGWFVGGGVLAILLGVASAAPVISHPFLVVARTLFARVFGSVGNLAGENSLRNPRRTTATASALMIGLALGTTMAIVGDSAKSSVDRSIAENFVGDYVVSNIFAQPFSPQVADQMAAVDGVQKVVRERFVMAERDGEAEGLSAIDPGAVRDFELRAVDGSLGDLADGTVALDSGYADDHDLQVGDTMTWTVPSGEEQWRVVATYEENPLVFYPVLTTIGTLDAAKFTPGDNALVLFTDGRPGLQGDLDAVVADNPVVTVKDQAAFAEERRGPIDNLVRVIFALLGLALLIAVLGIVNTLALSIIERTREVGLLRAIGVSRPQLWGMVTLESVVISVLGALLGVVLGTGFGVALMYSLRDEGLEVISVPWVQLGLFLGLAVLVGVLAAVFPARRAARLDVLRAISTE